MIYSTVAEKFLQCSVTCNLDLQGGPKMALLIVRFITLPNINQMTHWSRRYHWPVVWSLVEPGMWPPNSSDLNLADFAVWDALQQMAYQC